MDGHAGFATVRPDRLPQRLGLSVEAYDSSEAMSAGVLLQLTAKPSFHTNLGAINTNNATANVTWRLYDKNNNLVAVSTRAMPAYAVVAPTNMTSFFTPGSADITDAWVSFTSDQPIIAYASINDDVTTDPTYIPMLTDSGLLRPLAQYERERFRFADRHSG